MFFEPSFLYHLKPVCVYVSYTFSSPIRYLKNLQPLIELMKTNPFRYTQGAWSIARAPLTYANVERTMNMTDNL